MGQTKNASILAEVEFLWLELYKLEKHIIEVKNARKMVKDQAEC